ncbi:MAG: recombinase family protein [Actinomycetota bacterium]
MARTAIYCRISQDRGNALGVKRQESDCREFCERRGWDVVDVLVDNDVSAFSGKRRPGYERLLSGIDEGVYDSVVVWHPDRLHRSPLELEDFIALVERTGVAVASVTAGDYDLGTPEGRLTARVVGSVARKESEDKSRRLRRKHQELAAQGKVSGGGRRPFGYEADRVTVRSDEADLIRDAASRALAGESIRSITLDWQRSGVQTVTGTAWSPTTVRRLLMSARISGQREHHGTIIGPAEWAAVIEPADTIRLRTLLTDPARRNAGAPRSYLLSGLVTCGACGSSMTATPVKRKGHSYRRYSCTVDRGGCGRCGISAEGLEGTVIADVIAVLDSPALAAAAALDTAPVVDRVAEIEHRLSELAEIFAAGKISSSEWLTARDALDARLVDARSEAAEAIRVEETANWVGRGLAETWGDLIFGQQRAAVEAVVRRVTIAPTTKANNRYDEDRVSIDWLR